MALKQTRRTISFNREVYEAIMSEAAKRGVSASAFVESLVREVVPGLPETWHMTPDQVQAMRDSRVRSPFVRGDMTPEQEPKRRRPLRNAEAEATARRFVEDRERTAQRILIREVEKLRRRWGVA